MGTMLTGKIKYTRFDNDNNPKLSSGPSLVSI